MTDGPNEKPRPVNATPMPRCEPEEKVCPRCAGTGLVCAHTPVISPGCCCVDFGNAICPDCGGSGKIRS